MENIVGDRIGRAVMALVVLVGSLLLGAVPAWAHNSLVEAAPAKNASLTNAPAEVKLKFLAGVAANGTSLTVTGPAGTSAIGAVQVSGKTVAAPFTAMDGGDFLVEYEVMSADGHPVKGSYTFTVVGQASPTPTASAQQLQPAAISTAAASDIPVSQVAAQEEETPWFPWIAGAALAGLILGGLISWWKQRRSRREG